MEVLFLNLVRCLIVVLVRSVLAVHLPRLKGLLVPVLSLLPPWTDQGLLDLVILDVKAQLICIFVLVCKRNEVVFLLWLLKNFILTPVVASPTINNFLIVNLVSL